MFYKPNQNLKSNQSASSCTNVTFFQHYHDLLKKNIYQNDVKIFYLFDLYVLKFLNEIYENRSF